MIYVGVPGNEKPEILPLLKWDFSKLPSDEPKIAAARGEMGQEARPDRPHHPVGHAATGIAVERKVLVEMKGLEPSTS